MYHVSLNCMTSDAFRLSLTYPLHDEKRLSPVYHVSLHCMTRNVSRRSITYPYTAWRETSLACGSHLVTRYDDRRQSSLWCSVAGYRKQKVMSSLVTTRGYHGSSFSAWSGSEYSSVFSSTFGNCVFLKCYRHSVFSFIFLNLSKHEAMCAIIVNQIFTGYSREAG